MIIGLNGLHIKPVVGLLVRQQATWDQLKAELNVRFTEVTDAQHAIMLLREVQQKPGETAQVYAKRLLTLAKDAYPAQQGAAVQRQQIDIFVDGLQEDQLKLKVLRANPQTLDAAITTQQMSRTYVKGLVCVLGISTFPLKMMIEWRLFIVGLLDVVISVIKQGILLKTAIPSPAKTRQTIKKNTTGRTIRKKWPVGTAPWRVTSSMSVENGWLTWIGEKVLPGSNPWDIIRKTRLLLSCRSPWKEKKA